MPGEPDEVHVYGTEGLPLNAIDGLLMGGVEHLRKITDPGDED